MWAKLKRKNESGLACQPACQINDTSAVSSAVFSLLSLILISGFVVQPSVSEGQVLLRIDGSGADGNDGTDGQSFSGRAGTNQDGRDGGDAGPSTPGQDGKKVFVELSSIGTARGTVVIRGTVGAQGVSTNLPIGESGYIFIDTAGGDGGDGGDGGNAEGGGVGTTGSDATRSRAGGSGGTGGDGGEGGNASAGSDAGDGGDIVVRTREEDAHLLMLVDYDLRGGKGGARGEGGSGGAEGPGGPGGSSYFETVRVDLGQTCTTTESCTTSYGGNGVYTSSCRPVTSCRDNYRTDTYSQPGGSRGSSGRAGADGVSQPGGRDGRDGEYRIEVVGSDGILRTYQKRYDLHLLGFEFVSQNADGIFEPGERVRVKNIRVRNAGGMPMPSGAAAMIYLNDNRWVLSKGAEVRIDKVLAAGETYTLKNELEFEIADNHILKSGDRFRQSGVAIQPLSYLKEVNRQFQNFNAPQSFEITFPVEITPLDAPKSMARGETAKMFWRVKNLSSKPIGEGTSSNRMVNTWIESVKNADGYSGSVSGGGAFAERTDKRFLQRILELGPGESTLIEADVSVAANAPFYSEVSVRAGLDLERIDDADAVRTVQLRDFSIRVARTYEPADDADFLLVVNKDTQRAESEAWDELARRLGLKLAVWDLSYYGFFSLSKVLTTDSTLLRDFTRKPFVIINNPIRDSHGRAVVAKDSLPKEDFISAMSETGSGFYVVGGTADRLKEFMAPRFSSIHYQQLEKEFSGLKDVKDQLVYEMITREDFPTHPDLKDTKREWFGYRLLGDYARYYSSVGSTVWMRGAVTEENLRSEAFKVLQDIERVYPHKSVTALLEFDPVRQQSHILSGTEWSLGRILLRRTGGVGMGSGVAIDLPADRIQSPDFILSAENAQGLFMAMRFGARAAHLNRLLENPIMDLRFGRSLSLKGLRRGETSDLEYLRALSNAFISDLSFGIDMAVKQSHSLKKEENLEYELYNLRTLNTMSFPTQIDPSTAFGEFLVRIAAGLRLKRWASLSENRRVDYLVGNCTELFVDLAFGGRKLPLESLDAQERCHKAVDRDSILDSELSLNLKARETIAALVQLAQAGARVRTNDLSFWDRVFNRDPRSQAESTVDPTSAFESVRGLFRNLQDRIFSGQGGQ